MPKAFAVGTDDLEDVATALRYEQDGVRLRRALAKELREAVDPAVEEAKGRIMAMGSAGRSRGGSLRAAIAGQVKAQARLSGKSVGVRVRVAKKGMPRDFVNAPKRTNREKGWRHPVPPPRLAEGAEGPLLPPKWVQQVGSPGWFDDPMQERAPEYLAAVQRVIADTADRIRRGAS
jgi:hypothetical protein